jgi:putative membrane protein
MRRKQQVRHRTTSTFLTLTFIAIGSVFIAILISTDLKKDSVQYAEIASCAPVTAPVTFASTSIIPERTYSQDGTADQDFIMQAAEAGMAEVALGQLASEKASSTKVKDFGKMMVKDHTKANNELKALADKKGVTLPAECKMCKQKASMLDNVSGKDFDKKYMDMMVSDHNEVIGKFTKESSQGKDSDLKSWAQQTLPTLKHHLSEAQSIKP